MKRTGIKPQSAKRAAKVRQYVKNRADVLEACDGQCVPRVSPFCTHHASQTHHILPRSAGGRDDVSNLLACCTECHSYVHANPELSYRRGFLSSRYSTSKAG